MQAARLESVVRSIIAPILLTAPRECGIVSITEIVLSPDAEHVTVYISSLTEIKKALQFLVRNRRKLQHSLTQLDKKRVPMLRFAIDERIERGARIDALLSKSE